MKRIASGLGENPVFQMICRILVLSVASLLMAVNIDTFVHAGGLYPGGASGLTILVQRVVEMRFGVRLPYTVINIIFNAGPVYISYKYIGKKFTLLSVYTIMLTNILTDLLPDMAVTSDLLLISVFGGLVQGAAIALCLSVNATTGGTDFISIYLSEKKGVDSWNVVLGINAVILLAAGLLFGWEKALYSIIFQYVSTQVLHVLYKRYQQQTLLIVTEKPAEICAAIYDICHHGATVLEGEGSYEHEQRRIVYSVISSADLSGVMRGISRIDPGAFTNVIRTTQLSGHFYYKPQD